MVTISGISKINNKADKENIPKNHFPELLDWKTLSLKLIKYTAMRPTNKSRKDMIIKNNKKGIPISNIK